MGYRGRHARYRRTSRVLRTIVVVLVLFMLVYPFLEPYWLEVQTTSLTSSALSSDIKRLRIVYVSDIHEGSWPYFTHNRTEQLVRQINSLNADIVILGGDYATDSQSAVTFFENLPSIHANYGVYAILGDTDRSSGEVSVGTLRTAMRSAHITPIVNEVVPVRIGTNNVYLAGIDDVTNGWPELANVASQVSADDLVIFLSHSPAVIPDTLTVADSSGRGTWFDLGLFGHTHGGQMAFFGGLIHQTDVNSRYTRGWLVENKANLLISNGIGTSGAPMRLFRRPQIHVINMTSGR